MDVRCDEGFRPRRRLRGWASRRWHHPGEVRTLTSEQKAFVDLHTLRAVGTEPPALADDNGVVIEFWRRNRETADESYDEIRGWAIGNSLPVRGAIEV